jgi:hypothetical protein
VKRALLAALAAVLLVAAGPQDEAVRVLAAPDPGAVDYFAVKEALGPEGYKDFQKAVSETVLARTGGAAGSTRCWTRAEAELMGGSLLAGLSTSRETWTRDHAAGRAALRRLDGLSARFAAGDQVEPPYDGFQKELAVARTLPDPRKAELFSRVARDQFARTHLSVLSTHTGWAEGPSPNAIKHLLPTLSLEMCAVDAANTAWLKADLAKHGWYRISTAGEQADRQAWLLVQHADRDPAFQRQVLGMLEGLLPAKETSPRNYAYLYDRVASGEKRPQRYGTQGRCTGPGKWEPKPLEDAARVDDLRKSVGLEPLAVYVAGFKNVCR